MRVNERIKILKKVLCGFCLVLSANMATALPDIASFNDCADIIFHSGFGNDSQPSNGIGGNFPGSFTRTVFSQGQNRNYYVSIPPNYDPLVATPMMIAWHGAGGAGTAPAAAQSMRDYWKPTADANNFIVLSQAGTNSFGGWSFPNDITILNDILNDINSAYNIEKTRVYGHGFSAGGHLMHTLMLFYNNGRFAGYAVSAGVFEGDAINEDPNVPANSTIIPVYISHGNNDNTVPVSLANSNYTKFIQAGWNANKNIWKDIFTGGHTIKPQLASQSWQKLCTFSKLNPL